jgi:hypothetical protein
MEYLYKEMLIPFTKVLFRKGFSASNYWAFDIAATILQKNLIISASLIIGDMVQKSMGR